MLPENLSVVLVCERVRMRKKDNGVWHSNYICDSIDFLWPTGPACNGKDHEGMLVCQWRGSPHRAAGEEVAIPAESTRGHQDIVQQPIIFTLPIHFLYSSLEVCEGATSAMEVNQGYRGARSNWCCSLLSMK